MSVSPKDQELGTAAGLFGKITVGQSDERRYLAIEQEREGSFYLIDGQPGHLPASQYTAGFLPAGCHSNANTKATNALMLGLGAGAGVIALLSNFSKLHITVVEIDPEIIEIACRYFPLLAQYVDSGRLNIICQDAFSFVQTHSQAHPSTHFDFAIIDIYQGNFTFARKLRELDFLSALNSIASLIVVNLLPLPNKRAFNRVIKDFDRAGIKLKMRYPIGDRKKTASKNISHILYSQAMTPALGFEPYLMVPEALRSVFCSDYVAMLSRCEKVKKPSIWPW
jgi:hypothetical protein